MRFRVVFGENGRSYVWSARFRFGGLLCYMGSAKLAGKLSTKKSEKHMATNASKMVRTVHVAANLYPLSE